MEIIAREILDAGGDRTIRALHPTDHAERVQNTLSTVAQADEGRLDKTMLQTRLSARI